MAKKLTELFKEAVAKAETEEGRQELREQRERMEAEALRNVEKAVRSSTSGPGGRRSGS